MKITLDLDKASLAALVKKIEKIGKKGHEAAVAAVKTTTDKLEEESVRRCPFEEGFLERSHDKYVDEGSILLASANATDEQRSF